MTSDLRGEAEGRIDAFLRSVGLDPSNLRDERGMRAFGAGTVQGRAGVIEHGERLVFVAEAEVAELPADGELIVPLMRELLERNAVSAPGHLGIRDDAVVLVAVRDLAEGAPDVDPLIRSLMAQAAGLSEALAERYGGTSRRRTPPPPGGLDRQPEPSGLAADIAAQSRGEPPPSGGLFALYDRLRRERE